MDADINLSVKEVAKASLLNGNQQNEFDYSANNSKPNSGTSTKLEPSLISCADVENSVKLSAIAAGNAAIYSPLIPFPPQSTFVASPALVIDDDICLVNDFVRPGSEQPKIGGRRHTIDYLANPHQLTDAVSIAKATDRLLYSEAYSHPALLLDKRQALSTLYQPSVQDEAFCHQLDVSDELITSSVNGGDNSPPNDDSTSHRKGSLDNRYQSFKMNQVCKVCGEPAAGFHFGAFTCEGCKSFFGRSYNNPHNVGECKNSNACLVNRKNRTSCKACRLRKCLMVGMSKQGSRYGRRSNWFKIHCLLQSQRDANGNIIPQTAAAAAMMMSASQNNGEGDENDDDDNNTDRTRKNSPTASAQHAIRRERINSETRSQHTRNNKQQTATINNDSSPLLMSTLHKLQMSSHAHPSFSHPQSVNPFTTHNLVQHQQFTNPFASSSHLFATTSTVDSAPQQHQPQHLAQRRHSTAVGNGVNTQQQQHLAMATLARAMMLSNGGKVGADLTTAGTASSSNSAPSSPGDGPKSGGLVSPPEVNTNTNNINKLLAAVAANQQFPPPALLPFNLCTAQLHQQADQPSSSSCGNDVNGMMMPSAGNSMQNALLAAAMAAAVQQQQQNGTLGNTIVTLPDNVPSAPQNFWTAAALNQRTSAFSSFFKHNAEKCNSNDYLLNPPTTKTSTNSSLSSNFNGSPPSSKPVTFPPSSTSFFASSVSTTTESGDVTAPHIAAEAAVKSPAVALQPNLMPTNILNPTTALTAAGGNPMLAALFLGNPALLQAMLSNVAQQQSLATATAATSTDLDLLQRIAAVTALSAPQQQPTDLASFFGNSSPSSFSSGTMPTAPVVATNPSSITTSPVSPSQALAPSLPPLPFNFLQQPQNMLLCASAPSQQPNPFLMQALLGSLLHQQSQQQQQELQPPFISSTSEENNRKNFQLGSPRHHNHRQGSAFYAPQKRGVQNDRDDSPLEIMEEEDKTSDVAAKRARSDRDSLASQIQQMDYTSSNAAADATGTIWRGKKQRFASIIERQQRSSAASSLRRN